MKSRTLGLAFAGGLLLAAFNSLPARAAGSWEWSVEPSYGRPTLDIAAHIDGGGAGVLYVSRVDASLRRTESMPGLRLEGSNGRFGFLIERERWSLQEDDRVPFLGGSVVAVADLEQTRFLAAATVRLDPAWTFFVGARATEAKEGLRVDFSVAILPDVRDRFSQTLVDGVVGVRFEHVLWRSLCLRARADASAGSSKRSWNALADLGWSVDPAERYTIFVGYRYGEQRFTDASNGARIEARIEQRGGSVGLRLHW